MSDSECDCRFGHTVKAWPEEHYFALFGRSTLRALGYIRLYQPQSFFRAASVRFHGSRSLISFIFELRPCSAPIRCSFVFVLFEHGLDIWEQWAGVLRFEGNLLNFGRKVVTRVWRFGLKFGNYMKILTLTFFRLLVLLGTGTFALGDSIITLHENMYPGYVNWCGIIWYYESLDE